LNANITADDLANFNPDTEGLYGYEDLVKLIQVHTLEIIIPDNTTEVVCEMNCYELMYF
jgi:hypothetical protein